MSLPRFASVRLAAACAALLFAACRAPGAPAQEFSLREWHLADGLPSEEVHRIAATVDGFLLIGGPDGLMRFDGSRFKQLASKRQLGANLFGILALLDSRKYGLLVGLRDGGLFRVDDGELEPCLWSAELGATITVALHERDDGGLWISTNGGRILLAQDETLEDFTPWAGPGLDEKAQFATDRAGTLWATNGEELARFVNGRFYLHPLPLQAKEIRIASSNTGALWVVADNRAFRLPDAASPRGDSLPSLIGAHFIHDMREDQAGRLWIGTRSQGLWVLENGKASRYPVGGDDIYRIFPDPDGNLWIGSNGYGLHRLRPRNFRIYDREDGLIATYTRTLCESADGSIWLSNGDGGLARISGDTIRLSRDTPEFESFSPYVVTPNLDGGVWTTTSNRIYTASDRDGFTLVRQGEFKDQPIITIAHTARNGDLLFAGGPGTLIRVAARGGARTELGETLPKAGIRCIADDEAGRIWIGTTDGGVYQQNGDGFVERRLPLESNAGPIQSIRIRTDETVWIATMLQGLVVIDGGSARSLGVAEGLPSDDIAQILFDDFGYVWLGSISGISKVPVASVLAAVRGETDSVPVVRFGRDDGLANLSCIGFFQPAAWKASDGQLWFTTRFGAAVFNPSPDNRAATPPRVFIDSVHVDGTRTPPAKGLSFSAGMHTVSFETATLCLSTPDNARTQTMLEGFDDTWADVAAGQRSIYPSLPPGSYRFRIRASNGIDAPDEAELSFEVSPMWHQTLAFRLVLAVALAGSLAYVVRLWSLRRLRQRLERLERAHAIERERTRIAQDIHDDLGASLTRISLLTEIAQRSDASKRDQSLDRIYQTVGELTRSMDEIVWAVNPKFDDIESLAYYLSNFAQKFLSIANIRCRLEIPDTFPEIAISSQARHNLFVCCKEALNNAVKHSGATEVTLAISATPERLEILVRDNGRGLNGETDGPRPQAATQRIASGHGVSNLQKRMAEVGGSAVLRRPQAHQGLTVALTVPLPPSQTVSAK